MGLAGFVRNRGGILFHAAIHFALVVVVGVSALSAACAGQQQSGSPQAQGVAPPAAPTRPPGANPERQVPSVPPAAALPPLPDFPGAGIANSHPPFLTGVTVEHADGTYRDGDELRIQFMAERDAQLYLLYHQANGKTLLLFPNPAQRESRVLAKQPVVIPGEGSRFKFRVQPPFGDEVLQVIASLKPVTELDELLAKAKQAPEVSSDLIKRLQERLSQDESTWTEHRGRIRTVEKSDAPVPQPLAGRAGVFVGVGRYPELGAAASHEELRRSAEAFHSVMLKDGALDKERTRLLLDDAATRDAIERSITEWLASASKPGDTVVVYFSGHLRQLPAAPPGAAKRPNHAFALLPADFKPGAAELPESEQLALQEKSRLDETALLRWLSELQGRQIVLILDTVELPSVSSGTTGSVTEAGAAAAGENPQSIAGPGPVDTAGRKFQVAAFRDAAERIRDVAHARITVLAACAPSEPSFFEDMPGKVLWFTKCLTEGIEDPARPRPLSAVQAHSFAVEKLKHRVADKHPARRREPVFLGDPKGPVVMAP